jgi:hypothetical protein
MVAFNASNAISDYTMTKFYKLKEQADSYNAPFPPNILITLIRVEEEAAHLVAVPSFNIEVQITDPENGK